MKIEQAKSEIKNIWLNWDDIDELQGSRYSNMAGLLLHSYLQNYRPDLLKFRCKGDKYQRINGWVMTCQNQHPEHLS